MRYKKERIFGWLLFCGAFLLKGCTGSLFEDEDRSIKKRAFQLEKQLMGDDGSPRPDWMKSSGEGVYKVGKPYKVNGVWYFPKEDYNYDEIGIASWYGPGFHQKTTANGELFDMDLISAAHKTLPLPSVARVTNLENGRSLIVRINDRGPFVNDRLLDLSRKAAELLGCMLSGTTKVRVELLPEESMTVAAMAQNKMHMKENGGVNSAAQASAGVVKFTNDSPAANGPENALAASEASAPEVQSTFSGTNFGGKPSVPDDSLGEIVSSLSELAPSVPKAPSSTKASPAPAPSGTGTIYLQVGAFGSAENAKRLASALSEIGAAKIQPFKSGGKNLYRVRFGPYDDAAQAKKVELAIANTGHTDVKLMID